VLSLRETGYTGDIVLSVSPLDQLNEDAREFLMKDEYVVLYAVDWECFKKSGKPIEDINDGFSDCRMKNFYGDKNGEAIVDPRDTRPVATARYELYWEWAKHYDSHSLLLLIDARDTMFQLNPFETNAFKKTNETADKGKIHIFGEYVKISDSSFNVNWLNRAYGKSKVADIMNQTVICSGSTFGEQVAIETYLRAMVAQFDATRCKMHGCDQGFHNYIFHKNILVNATGVSEIIFNEQGKGIVNNIGALAASEETPTLQDQGLIDDKGNLLNFDGLVSPVVHQYDRDEGLTKVYNHRISSLLASYWQETSEDNVK